MKLLLRTDTPAFFNDISETVRAFYPQAEITMEAEESSHWQLECTLSGDNVLSARAVLYREGHIQGEYTQSSTLPLAAGPLVQKRYAKRAVKLAVYHLLKNTTGKASPWGSLTGIRPTRLVYEGLQAGESREEIYKKLTEEFDLSPDRAALLFDIVEEQEAFIKHPAGETDIYIGIPFCVSRCSYCSFASLDSLCHEKLIEPYMAALFREMTAAADMMQESGRTLRCIYIGGGTPTALPTHFLAELLEQADRLFGKPVEYTVEAGRPDTIIEEKLRLIKAAGGERISINPQTLHDETLERIGRRHSAKQIFDAFTLAGKIGFETINADLIAGLPGEDTTMFRSTLEGILSLKPENITVHTLSLKKGSRLAEEMQKEQQENGPAGEMVEQALQTLTGSGYRPYYLYRQKYMAGNLENIGYTLPGHTGIYNIDIMEETTDILALGSGAISKRVFPGQGRIERAANVKSIPEYIQRTDEMLRRKEMLFK